MRTVVVATCAMLALACGCGKDPKTLLAPGKPDLPPPIGGLTFGMATAAWGAPVEGKEQDKDVKIWLNPEKGIRAYFTKLSYDNRLFIQPYSPLEAFLGKDGKAFGFEARQPIIGATRAQLASAYQMKDDRINFPPNRCGEMNVTRRETLCAPPSDWM